MPPRSRLLATAIALAGVLGGVSAQNSTTTPTTTTTVISLFLPVGAGAAQNLGASIITAAPDETAYAVGCIPPNPSATDSDSDAETPAECGFKDSITLTEGASTLVYTYNPAVSALSIASDSTTLTNPPAPSLRATVNCALAGGAHAPHFVPASQAVCTGRSAIQGLGNVVSTTTLASTQIEYVPVTVTAGVAGAVAASGRAGGAGGGGGDGLGGASAGGSGDGSGVAGNGEVRWGLLGVLGAALGLLGVWL